MPFWIKILPHLIRLESAFEFENEMAVRRFVTRELEKIWDFYEGVYSFVFYLRI